MLQSLRISQKIGLSFSILIVGYLFSMLIMFNTGQKTEVRLRKISAFHFIAAMQSQAALVAFNEQNKLYQTAVVIGDPTAVDEAEEKSKRVIDSLNTIIEMGGGDAELTEIADAIAKLNVFFTSAHATYRTMSSGAFDDTLSKKANQLNGESEELKKTLTSIQTGFAEGLNEELENISRDTRRQRYLNITIFFAVVVISVSCGFFLISKFITRPLKDTVAMIRDIAEGEGDLTKQLAVYSSDEVGELARWFNTFVGNLRKMISEISENYTSLGVSSNELFNLSSVMNQGTEQMSGKSQSVSGSAKSMSGNMDSIAVSMEETTNNINIVATSAEEMTATINEIAQNSAKASDIANRAVSHSKSASDRVMELGNAAKEVGNVTVTINEISEQTNLLALNATIEAARAGEAGRGFTVVANEIKELARQTATATLDIRKRIEDIQDSTSGTIDDISKISTIINEVSEIVSYIASSVEEQSVTTKEIAGNVVQASKGLEEVNKNVAESSIVSGQIANAIEDVNSAASEIANSSSQLNMSAEKLSSLAEDFNKMVGKFKI